MALRSAVRVQVGMVDLFPEGVQCLGVEEDLDFDKKRKNEADTQKRDKATGQPVWVVRVVDLDPRALEFGGSAQMKVTIVSDEEPVVPERQDPRFPPLVEFEGLELTPYADGKSCNNKQDRTARCKARVAFAIRATAMRPASASPVGVDGNGEVTSSKRQPGPVDKAA